MARTMAAGDPAQRALVSARLGDPALDADAVIALRRAIVASGALATVESTIDALTATALETIELTKLAEPGRSMLVELARAAVDRAA
jgi:geranylgeranyl diphosphate synthase type I